MYDLGDVVPLTVTVKDATGTLVDAGSVTCVITLPDGTTATPSVSHPSTGVYTATYTPPVAGRFRAKFIGTSGNQFAEPYWFDVNDDSAQYATPAELFALLGATGDSDRAALLIQLAVDLCSTVISPLPAAARSVVLSVAARAYANPQNAQSQTVGPFSASYGHGASGGLYLSRQDRATLQRIAGRGGAFTFDTIPATAGANLAPWDGGSYLVDDWDYPS